MGIVFRQSAKTSIAVFSGAVLGAIIIWLSTKYIPDKQQFGFLRNYTNDAVTISQLLILGLNSTLFVYTHRFSEEYEKRKVLLTIVLAIPLAFVILFSAVYFLQKEWILHHFQPADVPLMRRYFSWLPVYTLFFIYMVILEQYLGSQMKVAVSAFMREVVLRVLNVILIGLYATGYVGFDTLVVGSILIYLVPLIIFIAIASKIKGFGISFNFKAISAPEYREVFHFAWYHFLLSSSITLMSYMDVTALPFYDHRGLSDVAIYSVAVFILSFLLIPYRSLVTAVTSVLSKAFAENDLPKVKDIFVRSSINVFIPTVGMAVLICSNLGNAVAILGNGKDYSELIGVFLILLCGQLVNIATGINDQVLSVTNYYKFNFYASITVIAVLYLLIRLLVPAYGMYGAALSNAICLTLFNVMKLLIVWKKLRMQPFSKGMLQVILAALPAAAAGYFLPHVFDTGHHAYIHTFFDAALRSLVIVIVYMAMLLWLKPSADLQEYIAQVKKNKRLF